MQENAAEEPEKGGALRHGAAGDHRTPPLLDLDTLIVRPFITIDGQRYDILSPSEISVIESHRFGVWGKRIEELGQADGEDVELELSKLVAKVARAVALVGQDGGVPVEVFNQLTGSHKWTLVDVFTGLLLHNRLGVAGAIAKAVGLKWSIGEISSPGSSASTAAAPRGGWLRRLWRW